MAKEWENGTLHGNDSYHSICGETLKLRIFRQLLTADYSARNVYLSALFPKNWISSNSAKWTWRPKPAIRRSVRGTLTFV
jgi:hypothetical protein